MRKFFLIAAVALIVLTCYFTYRATLPTIINSPYRIDPMNKYVYAPIQIDPIQKKAFRCLYDGGFFVTIGHILPGSQAGRHHPGQAQAKKNGPTQPDQAPIATAGFFIWR